MKHGDAIFLKLQTILRHEDVGTVFNEDHPYFSVLFNILCDHPKMKEKMGNGVLGFSIAVSPLRRADRHFEVIRRDGSKVDFSFYKCCRTRSGKRQHSDSNYQMFYKGLRQIVQPVIDEFKRNAFGSEKEIVCPESGKVITVETAYISHDAPVTFGNLVKEFIVLNHINIDKIEFNCIDNDSGLVQFLDKKISEMFLSFYKERAKLRVLYWKESLRLARSNRFLGHKTQDAEKL